MRPRLSLAGQFLVLQLGIVLLVVGVVGAVSVAESDATFRRVEGRRLLSWAEYVAATDTVRRSLIDPAGNPLGRDALPAIAASSQAVSGVSYVLIADADGKLLTGPGVGSPAALGDPRVLEGRNWVGVLDDGVKSLVAQVPVLNEADGRVVGVVTAGLAYPTLPEQVATATPQLLTYLLIGAALGVVGSLLLARRVKRQTLGLEPQEITGLVEHREAMLHGIREGVVGTDTAERITLINDEAIRLLGLGTDAVGQTLRSQFSEPGVLDVLTGRVVGHDQVVLRGDRVLVLNRMPVLVRGRRAGWVTTLRDRTELTNLQRELDVIRQATDTLRAQAHEFTNRLHTIAGLVELGDYEEVVRFITRASQARDSLTNEVTSRIEDPAVAALLIAKASLAAEQGVALRISPESALPQLDEAVAADLVTVVGNLIDNALDALGTGGWVEAMVRTEAGDVVVTIRDSGPGVAPELAEEVFRRGYTTKDGTEGHGGIGLALIRLICTRRGGGVEVAGATFTARIPLSCEVRT
ncbi:MAG TPA: sensor histidine kinase [Pilimelia sp.]|nr:sensor histidine kinase [Pilimelia sp.]